MSTSKARISVAAAAAMAMLGLGAGSATAAGWPPLQEGIFLYSGTTGTGTVTQVDPSDVGTCHTLTLPARSVQVVSASVSVELYSGAACTAATPWRSGSLAQTDLPWSMLSYKVVAA